MVEMTKFPSIEQFRNVIRNVKARASYDGKDEDGNVKWKPAIAPKLKYVGTVKMHGTNSAIGITGNCGEVWFQSRNNVITPDSDNAGFARYMTDTVGIDELKAVFAEFYTKNGLSPNVPVVIYGEWCGSNIQKGVALCQLQKMFVVFAVRYGAEDDTVWLLPDAVKLIEVPSKNIFNIFNFTTYELEIDFENPHVAQEKLIELTLAVEKECPVGKAFGVSGVGEGIVWQPVDPEYRSGEFLFKVKGEEHSASKVKTLAAVDVERVNGIKELVDNIVTERRLQQGIEYLNEQHIPIDNKSMGPFLKWVAGDVFKEEMDTITENGFEQKDLGKEISNKARVWFLTYLQNNL